MKTDLSDILYGIYLLQGQPGKIFRLTNKLSHFDG